METREKQAYLIEAHKCDEMLLTLLRMLDVPWNDIFIHMDSKNTDYQPETVECRMKYAKVFHAKRHSVVWGGVSQVKAELVLLKTAVAHGPYQHYHLISGVDLPIQTQEDIRAFFEANPDVEFVHFDPHPFSPFNDERVYYRHFFQNIDLRRHPVLGAINGILLSGQKLLKIKRNQDVHFTKGSNWFSCTDGFARYLLTKEEWVLQVLDKTFCSDEFFVQTLIAQSPYQDKIYQGPGDTSARAIDWDRGNPWVWKYADLEQLKASPCMFARKFDIEKEPELVHEIERLYAPHI
jgi:hypothetical protein